MIFLSLAVFILGLIVGSFLNVVILRMRTGRSFMKGRSVCFSCGKTLRWFELIPLASFIVQKGRCRSCFVPLSWQYPLVECITGILFILVWCSFFDVYRLISLVSVFVGFVFVSFLMIAAVYDLRHMIIPDEVSYPLAVIGFLSIFFPVMTGGDVLVHLPTLLQAFSGPIVASFFGLLWLISKGKWMGLGDAKLALGIGWFLGFIPGISALVFSFWIGAFVILILFIAQMILRLTKHPKKFLKREIPFGPFLVLGTLVVYLCGLTLPQLLFDLTFL